MTGPRLRLHFGAGDCSPFANCTQRNNLLRLVRSLSFEDDGLENSMQCSHSSNSYTLMCRSYYTSMDQSYNSMEMSGVSDQIIWMVILVFAIIIVCLSFNTIRLVKKVRRYENKERKTEEEQNEIPLERVKMMP